MLSLNPPLFTTPFLRGFVFFLLLILSRAAASQQITGVWRGRIHQKNVEVKIIQKGDSLTGTSYYSDGKTYRRYSIKGYFDNRDNSVVWWDDLLLEGGNKLFASAPAPLLSIADFNCPGSGKMFLNGKASLKENAGNPKGIVDLTKVTNTSHPDEWDYVIDNFTFGTNHPDIIDSVSLVALQQQPVQKAPPAKATTAPPIARSKREGMVSIPPPPPATVDAPPIAKTITEKFTSRKKVFTTEIPVAGDSIELRFYDNAEIDGDSIALFLNDKLLFEHIRLTEKAYTIKLAVADLSATNELTMVAENLGSIPPNTSYMVALVGTRRYEARLASTENSSAVIKLFKE